MSESVRILGLDPGFASFGFAVLELGATASDDEVCEMGVWRTAKATKKRGVRATDDNVERGIELHTALRTALVERRLGMICAEAMSFPRSASVAGKMCIAWGLVIAEVNRQRLPFRQATPQEIKHTVCGSRSASKDDIQCALTSRYGDLLTHVAHLPGGQHEHAFDALAAIVACLDTDVVRMARASAAQRTA